MPSRIWSRPSTRDSQLGFALLLRFYGRFRECSVADAEKLTDWLAGDYAQAEDTDDIDDDEDDLEPLH